MRHYSGMLHNAILSIALVLSDDPELQSNSTPQRFAEKAKMFLEAERKQPSLPTIQGLLILSQYYLGLAEGVFRLIFFQPQANNNVYLRSGSSSFYLSKHLYFLCSIFFLLILTRAAMAVSMARNSASCTNSRRLRANDYDGCLIFSETSPAPKRS